MMDDTEGFPETAESRRDFRRKVVAVPDSEAPQYPCSKFSMLVLLDEVERLRETLCIRHREEERLRKALARYAACRHAVSECFCSVEARAALEIRR